MIVKQIDTGEYVIQDGGSQNRVAGPFPTNADAWRALERLTGEEAKPALPKRRKRTRVVDASKSRKRRVAGASPKKKSKKRAPSKAEKAKADRKLKVNAHKAPGWIRRMAMQTFDPVGERVYRESKMGKFGPASEVRHIDPAEYLKAREEQPT